MMGAKKCKALSADLRLLLRVDLVQSIRRYHNAARIGGKFPLVAMSIFGISARAVIFELGGMAGEW